MAEKRTIELEIQDNSKTLKQQYKDAVKELQNVAAAYGETSAEAVKAAQKAAELKDQIGFTNDLVDAFNPDAKFTALSRSIGGVLDGFQAVQGGLGLIGVEGQAVEEAMLKVQSAMALSQGIQGLMEAKDSFKQLGTVAMDALKGIRTGIAATGIGLLIVAVGLLVANFDKLKDAFSSALGKAKAFEKGVSEQAAAARDAVNNFGEYERTLRRLGKTQDEIEKKRRERFKQAIEDTEKELKANKKVYQEQLKNLESVRTADKYGFNFVGRLIYGDEEDAKAQRAKVKETRAQLEKLKNDKFEFEQKIKDDAKQKREEDLQDYKDKIKAKQDLINADLEKIRENNRVALEENQARLRTEQEQEEYLINQKFNEQIKLAKKYGKDTTQLELAQANEINGVRLKYQEIDYKQKEEARQKELDAIKQANDLKKQAEEEFQAQIEQIDESNFQARLQKSMSESDYEKELVRQKYFALEEAAKGNAEQEKIIAEAKAKEIEAIDKKSKEKQIQQENELRQKRLQLTASAFTAIGDLIGSFATKSDKDARKQFQIQKAFNLAAAVTNTAMAVTGALTAGGNPIKLATGAQFVEAGIAATVGAANIVKIASSKFGSGSSGGGGGAPAGGGGGGAQMAAPQFQTIGTSGVNQLATLQQQPTKAYVVSGEVTSAQSLDRNRVQNATL
jgi:hypothetical protein